MELTAWLDLMLPAPGLLGASDSYASGGQTLVFSSLEHIQGGSMADSFTVNGAHRGNITGGAGADVFTLAAAVSGSVSGEGGGDSFTLNNGGSVSMGISGGADADTFTLNSGSMVAGGITGGAGADVFTLAGAVTDSVSGEDGSDSFTLDNGSSVSGDITGGAGADSFDFNGGTVAGTVAGGADDDTLDFADTSAALTIAFTMVDSDGFTGSVTGGPVSMFSGINTIAGGSGTDSMTGLNADAAWILGASDSYASGGQTLVFSLLEHVQGGAMADSFTVNGAHSGNITGGDGADVFTLTAAVSGSVSGDGGDDSFTLNNGGSVSMGISGGADADTFILNSGSNVSMGISGGAGAGTFTLSSGSTVVGGISGGADADVFTLAGTVTGSVSGEDGADSFTLDSGGSVSMGISGGAGADTFTLNSGSSVAGGISGGADADVFTLAGAVTGSVSGEGGDDSFTLNSGGSVAGNISGGADADVFTLAGAVSGSVSGEGGGDSFTLDSGGSVSMGISGGTGADTFTLNSGSSIAGGIRGGTGADSFILNSGSSVSMGIRGDAGADMFDFNGGTVMGIVAGGTGRDSLDFADMGTALVVALSRLSIAPGSDGFAGSVSGGATVGFTGVNAITGGSGTDSLAGLDAASTWTLGAAGSYASGGQRLMFSALEHVQGGSMADAFTINGVHGGNVMGGAGADRFMFAGGTVAGDVTGGAGADILDFSMLGSTVMVALSGRPDSSVGFAGYVSGAVTLGDAGTSANGFTGITHVIGSAATGDSFTGINEASTFTLDASGGMPIDTYSIDAVTPGGNPYLLRLDSIESYVGGSDSDSYIVNRAYMGDLVAGDGANSFTVNAAVRGNISSGNDTDTITVAAVVTGDINVGDGADTVTIMPGGSIMGELGLGEGADPDNDAAVDVLDVSMFGSPLTLIYTENGGSAYAADGTYGSMNGVVDAVIMGDGHGDGVNNGMFGAERIIGTAHNPDAGTGSYLVVQPTGDSYSQDLAINGVVDGAISLMLPDISQFPGHVLIGGSGVPPFPLNEPGSVYLPLSVPGINTLPESATVQEIMAATVVQARKLIIAGELAVPGSLVLMGSAVELRADVYTGVTADDTDPAMATERENTELAIIATGGAGDDFDTTNDFADDGLVVNTLGDMERERNIYSGHALMVIRENFTGTISTVVYLEDGMLQFVQGDAGTPLFDPTSLFIGTTLQPNIDRYIGHRLGLPLGSQTLSVFNPASELVQASASPVNTIDMDTGFFEKDLTPPLFDMAGEGISLYLSMCNGAKNCAPPMELEEIDAMIQQAVAKLAELRRQLQDSTGSVRAYILESLYRFEKVVRDLNNLRQEVIEALGENNSMPGNDGVLEVSVPPWEYNTLAQAGIAGYNLQATGGSSPVLPGDCCVRE